MEKATGTSGEVGGQGVKPRIIERTKGAWKLAQIQEKYTPRKKKEGKV
jgi:hypothetical protein